MQVYSQVSPIDYGWDVTLSPRCLRAAHVSRQLCAACLHSHFILTTCIWIRLSWRDWQRLAEGDPATFTWPNGHFDTCLPLPSPTIYPLFIRIQPFILLLPPPNFLQALVLAFYHYYCQLLFNCCFYSGLSVHELWGLRWSRKRAFGLASFVLADSPLWMASLWYLECSETTEGLWHP